MEHQIFEMQVEFMQNGICVFNRQNVRDDLFLKPSMKIKYLRLSEHNFQLIFLVLRALQTDYLSLYRLASSCMFDIMQFRQHCAHDKQNDNFDLNFFGINLKFSLK